MRPTLTIQEFLDQYQPKLHLSFASNPVGLERKIQLSRQASDTFDAADYFNIIRTPSVVVIGYLESRYIHRLAEEEQRKVFRTLFRGPVCLIICSQGNGLPPAMIDFCETQQIPVLQSDLDDAELLDNTRYLLSRALAETCNEHGVFIEVFSMGVFITGNAAIGKSELALELISRGHRLVSDDVTLFSRDAPDVVNGRSPDLLTDFLEVRGLGIVNIRAMFGANALKRSMPLSLIVNMVEFDRSNRSDFDRLGNDQATRELLGLEFPEVALPVAPGRNLATLVEAATRNHLLQANGYNAGQHFITSQNRAVSRDSKSS